MKGRDYLIEMGKIIYNRSAAQNIWLMKIYAPEIAAVARPGQFVNIRLSEQLDPLLRRPISLHGIDPENGTISMLYMVVGRGTEQLTKMEPEASINVLGPLGNGFCTEFAGDQAILLGGGIGVAPLYPLAQALVAKGKSVRLLVGAKSQEYLSDTKPYQELGVTVEISTDDGSYGYHGFVTELLEKAIAEHACEYLYACGPTPMLRAIESKALEHGVKGQVSTESHMGCGLGVCLCCPNKVKAGGYKKTCEDGPVFEIGVLDYA
jgi:dihydroorotate dehydrogenase electron transfer subunit